MIGGTLAALAPLAPCAAVASPTNLTPPFVADVNDPTAARALVRPDMQLACAGATWSGATYGAVVRGWYPDDGSSVGSAETYVVASGDVGHAIHCLMWAIGDLGSIGTSSSPPVTVVPAGSPIPTVVPSLLAPNPQPQRVLTCNPGTWDGPRAPLSIRWLRDGVTIGRAVAQGLTYTVLGSDPGHTIACAVRAQGTSSPEVATPAVSIGAAPPLALVDHSATASLAGPPGLPVGSTLLCVRPMLAGPYPSASTRWSLAGHAVAGASSVWLAVLPTLAGASVSCTVTHVDITGASLVVASPAVTVAPLARPTIVAPGIAAVSSPLAPGDGTRIARATSATHKVTRADRGKALACRAAASNSAGTTVATSRSVKVR